mmetsp:Transcript_63511/g.187508  ORF Transcript_63511/g.187508 Transcript_63511/m.187508 type:complete len:228 (-) Transcript_63511:201-884(-)
MRRVLFLIVVQHAFGGVRAFVGPAKAGSQRSSAIAQSFLDNFFGVSKNGNEDVEQPFTEKSIRRIDEDMTESKVDPQLDAWDLRAEIDRRNERTASGAASAADPTSPEDTNLIDFDGYAFRDIIVNKWGECFDLEFQPVWTLGFRELYLNVMPFCLSSRRFRHASEYDYLCHLQAVVEILVKYEQLDSVLAQIAETKKKPRAGTSPLVAVPLRLDLSSEQLDEIMGN